MPLHIIQRGNNRSACFACEADYQVYLSLLQDYAAHTDCDVHAYVLMTNHVHLLLSSPGGKAPSVLMRRLGQHYVQYFNRRHGRTGTLWEGRFRSSLVDADSYLVACQRYIELNPVRAGMVDEPGRYRWSSYHANALGALDSLVTPHALYLGLGAHAEARQTAYRRLFQEALPEAQVERIRQAGKRNAAIGSAEFVSVMSAADAGRSPSRPRGRPRLVGDRTIDQKMCSDPELFTRTGSA
jgi:putative transposase